MTLASSFFSCSCLWSIGNAELHLPLPRQFNKLAQFHQSRPLCQFIAVVKTYGQHQSQFVFIHFGCLVFTDPRLKGKKVLILDTPGFR